jgi:hypothetical protein
MAQGDRGITARIMPADCAFLEARGAVSLRGAHTFSRSAVLRREIDVLRALLDHYDPRRGTALPEPMLRLATRLLAEPWLIKPAAVEHLALRLQEAPGFAAQARAAGIDPAALVAAVAGLSFGEKAALLDLAVQEQAAGAAAIEVAG